MKIEHVINEIYDTSQKSWNGNPTIGWYNDNLNYRLYYGTHISKVKENIKEGFNSRHDDILFAFEPNTALVHAAMRIHNSLGRLDLDINKRAVIEVVVPRDYLHDNIIIENDINNRLHTKKIYEQWGKSDVEFYAFVNVKIPTHIPPDFINGYMVKNNG